MADIKTSVPPNRTNTSNRIGKDSSTTGIADNETDQRSSKEKRLPFEQRVEHPRPARRMNLSFKYLYRHNVESTQSTIDALTFLQTEGNYTFDDTISMNRSFPVLLELSIQQQLYPKIQFLKHTLGQKDPSVTSHLVPPFYFGARLERIIAPRHAFLVWAGLPSGRFLFDEMLFKKKRRANDQLNEHPRYLCLFQEFMMACRNTKQFAAMCQSWRMDFGLIPNININSSPPSKEFFRRGRSIISKDVEAFDSIFSRGLLAAARDDLVQSNNTWAASQLPTLTAAEVTRLLIQHGADPLATDHRGATLLHWACGNGSWETAKELLQYHPAWTRTTRDGATPLHWAAAGTNSREFGVGGHLSICQNLLNQLSSDNIHTHHLIGNHKRKAQLKPSLSMYVNQQTFDGNSALMWAAWSGTLETVKLLVRNRADTTAINQNGCSVAHWASSGGNLAVCQYLHRVAKVDFFLVNKGGSTPLTHAVTFGRTDVVRWLIRTQSQLESSDISDSKAYHLAQEFCQWTKGEDATRNMVLQQFFYEGDLLDVGCTPDTHLTGTSELDELI